VVDIRGRGLLWGVELKPAMHRLQGFVARLLPDKDVLSELTGAVVLSELLHSHDVLAYLGFSRRNLIVFSPALTVQESDLDHAVGALDKILSTPWAVLGSRFAAHAMRG
jgi:acetylornithine/succinyldiaminopimelate/putrescine aminotransferase